MYTRLRRVTVAALLMTAMAGCMALPDPVPTGTTPSSGASSVASEGTPARITGTATYRERVALPPDAMFEAVIEDVAKADAPATVLGRTGMKATGVPVSFTIDYDPARLDPRARYSVRTRILVDGRPWFTSDTIHPVLRSPGDTQVDIVMRRVASAP